MTQTIGLFGLGLIGMAAATRLIAAGHKVIGHDPAPDRQAALFAAGGMPADPGAVWDSARIVLIAVFDAAQAQTVLEAAPVDGQGICMLLSTCAPEATVALGETARARGWTLVEAPVSGTSAQLEGGTASIYLGGEDRAVAEVVPVAEALSAKVVAVGTLGNAARVKLAVNLILGLNRAALAEGLLLARGMGLDPGNFLALARDSAAASAVMRTKGPRMVAGDFAPEGRVAQSAKDFGLILDAAQAAGQGLPFARTYAQMMQDCIANAEGDMDNAAIIRALARCRPGAEPPA
jgi:3-hydroxyisobutyrate dehydrogenase-like beta-hydroxyacid dehydrogenase